MRPPLPALLEAFRTGGGVPYADYGADIREGIGRHEPADVPEPARAEWLPPMPDVDARLRADPPARVADVGCGAGWSSIAIARAYPKVRVDGFDLDEASIARARATSRRPGVGDRVHVRSARRRPTRRSAAATTW